MLPILALVVGIGIFLAMMALDRARIRNYVAGRGGRVVSLSWHPFGSGWFGEKDSNIYMVRYRDADGSVHQAHCKTGLFSGVYFTADNIISRGRTPAPPTTAVSQVTELERLRRENERLSEENRRLRQEIAERRG